MRPVALDSRHAYTAALLAGALAIAWPGASRAAICTWNNPGTGAWTTIANWTGCADAPGPSTRFPGAGDVAVLGGGTATIGGTHTVAELELGAGGLLSATTTAFVTVSTALRLAGGGTTTQLGLSQLILTLPSGATTTLLASSTFGNATFVENTGVMALGSNSGVALTLSVASELRNKPAARSRCRAATRGCTSSARAACRTRPARRSPSSATRRSASPHRLPARRGSTTRERSTSAAPGR
jgi:hypothetical protein